MIFFFHRVENIENIYKNIHVYIILKMMIFVFHRVENIVGKREKCWLPVFSSCSINVSKGFFCRVRCWDCIVKS